MARKSVSTKKIKIKVVHEIREMKVSDLKGWNRNPREISDEALAGLTRSIEEFGLVQPIVWNKKTKRVVGGHQRLQVLKAQGIEKVNVTVVDLTPKREKVLNVALNNPEIAGTFSGDIKTILEEIENDDVEVFDEMRFDMLIPLLNKNDQGFIESFDDDDDELDSRVKKGDKWILGKHVLFCDEAKNVDFDGEFMFTDPPWELEASKVSDIIFGNNVKFWGVWCKTKQAYAYGNDERFNFGCDFIWYSSTPRSQGRGNDRFPHLMHNHILIGGDHTFNRKLSHGCFSDVSANFVPSVVDATDYVPSVIEAKRINTVGHSHAKDLDKVVKLLRCFKFETICDPFVGSGTFILASQILGKSSICSEIEPRFCDVVLNRWEKMTEMKAKKA